MRRARILGLPQNHFPADTEASYLYQLVEQRSACRIHSDNRTHSVPRHTLACRFIGVHDEARALGTEDRVVLNVHYRASEFCTILLPA